MQMNRLQFQKGLSLPHFMARYGTEAQCEQALIAARWPDGFVCPAYSARHARATFRREGRLYWQCAVSVRRTHLDSTRVYLKDRVHLIFTWTRWQATRWWAGGGTAKS